MDSIRKTCAVIFIATLAMPAYTVDFSANSRLSYLGQQIVPTGATFNGTTIGGLSSLDYSNSTAQYFAICDDRSNIYPARFYELSLDLDKFQRSSTLGPRVNDKETLILVSDNNFNHAQFTQFVALQITPVPEPETNAMLFAGFLLVGEIIRRRTLLATSSIS